MKVEFTTVGRKFLRVRLFRRKVNENKEPVRRLIPWSNFLLVTVYQQCYIKVNDMQRMSTRKETQSFWLLPKLLRKVETS